MKKYFLTVILVLISFANINAQWNLKSNSENGKFSLVTNSDIFFGISSGRISAESMLILSSSDTSAWRLVTNTENGLYSFAENKVSFMGIDSGKVRTKAIYVLNPSTLLSLGLDTNRAAYTDKSNSFIGRKQTFDTINVTTRYLLNGVNINTAGTLSNMAYLNQANSFSGNIGITAPSLTGSSATPILDVTQTWNTSGTPTAFKMNITNTASNIASLFIDFQLGGSSVFSVRKDGRVIASALISQSDVVAGPNNGITFSGRTQLSAPTGGSLVVVNTTGGAGATINAGSHLPTMLNTFSLGTTGMYYTTSFTNNVSTRDTTITVSSTVTSSYPEKILVDATSGNITITFPNDATLRSYNFKIKRIDNSGNTVTLSTAGTIDDSPTKSVVYNTAYTVSCTGSGIYKIF